VVSGAKRNGCRCRNRSRIYRYRVPGIREYKKIQEPGVRLLEPDFSITTTITTTTTKSAAGGGPGSWRPEPGTGLFENEYENEYDPGRRCAINRGRYRYRYRYRIGYSGAGSRVPGNIRKSRNPVAGIGLFDYDNDYDNDNEKCRRRRPGNPVAGIGLFDYDNDYDNDNEKCRRRRPGNPAPGTRNRII
jgi:hypothetical protein